MKNPHLLRPQEFRYDARRLRRTRAFLYCLCVFSFLFLPAAAISRHAGEYRELGPLFFVGLIALVLPLSLAYALIVYVVGIPRIKDGLLRTRQGISVDNEGITFTDGHRIVHATWSEITGINRVQPGRNVIVSRVIHTPQGDFDYTLALSNALRLDQIIRKHAVNAVYTTETPDDEIAPHPAIPGAHIYHYRTYTNRALLMLPLGFVLISLVICLLQACGFAEYRNPLTTCIFGFGSLAVWAWCFWRYRTVTIRTDSLGITRQDPSGRIFIPWTDIRKYRLAGGDVLKFAIVTSSQSTIRFWYGISDFPKLKDEIEARIGGTSGYIME